MSIQTILDVHGQEWTLEEAQTLVNQLKSMTLAAKRLGLKSIKPLRDLGVKSIPEYIREKVVKDPTWLPAYILRQGSIQIAAAYLNVSVSFLEGELKSLGYQIGET